MVYTTTLPPTVYPNDRSLHEFIFSNESLIPDDQLIFMDVEDNSKALVFSQVKTQILKCIAGIKNRWHINYGEVVAICSPNQIDYPIALHGIVCAGICSQK